MYYIAIKSRLDSVNYGFYGISELVKNLYVKIEFSTTPFLHIQIRFLHTVLHILDKPIGVAYIIT